MKKVFYLLILLFGIVFLPNVIYASGINITSVELDSKSDSATIVSDPVFDGLNLNVDIKFRNDDDYVKYKVNIKNDDKNEYEIDGVTTTNEYFDYSVEGKTIDGNSIDYVLLTIRYKGGVSFNIEENKTFDRSLNLEVTGEVDDDENNENNGNENNNGNNNNNNNNEGSSNSEKDNKGEIVIPINPKTYDSIIKMGIVFIMAIIGLIISIYYYKRNTKVSLTIGTFVFIIVCLIPVIYASSRKLSIVIGAKIEIEPKVTILDIGKNVNKRMKITSGSVDAKYKSKNSNIKIITRKDKLPEGFEPNDNNTISIEDSEYPIYIWYDKNILYYYSDADFIYFNRDSSYFYYNLNRLKKDNAQDFIGNRIEDMTLFYGYCVDLNEVDISYFGSDNLKSIDGFIYETLIEKLNMSHFNFGKIDQLYDTSIDGYYPVTTYSYGYPFSNNKVIKELDLSYSNMDNIRSLQYAFSHMDNLVRIDFSHVNVNKVKKFDDMFSYNINLEYADLSYSDTSSLETMNYMFSYNYKLETVKMDGLSFDKLKYVSYMFKNCSSLKKIDFSGMKTPKLENVSNMFYECSSLEEVNISGWGSPNLTSVNGLFYYANNLKRVNMSGFNFGKVYTDSFFGPNLSDSTELEYLDLSNADISDATYYSFLNNIGSTKLKKINMSGFKFGNLNSFYFSSDLKIEELDLSNADGSKMTETDYVFINLNNLKKINLKNADFSNVKNANNMFTHLPSLVELDLEGIKMEKVTTMIDMFYNLPNLKYLDISSINTSNVVNMSYMFSECTSLKNIKFGDFDTSNVLDMGNMFRGLKLIEELDLSNFNTSKVENMSSMFYGCSSLKSLNLDNWVITPSAVHNTSSLIGETNSLKSLSMKNWKLPSDFSNNSIINNWYQPNTLESVDVSGWDVSNTIVLDGLFSNATALREIKGLNTWDVSNVVYMNNLFKNCVNLKVINLDNWSTTSLKTTTSMFEGCSNLEKIVTDSGFDNTQIMVSNNMFKNDMKLVGGAGTEFNSNYINKEYAHLDGGNTNPGYFTQAEDTPSEFIVTFIGNGGNVDTSFIKVHNGSSIGELPTPTWDEYHVFDGWFLSLTSGIKVDSNYRPNSDISLYARWNELEKYTITFNSDKGVVPNDIYVKPGKPIGELPILSYNGYVFVGWFDNNVLITEDYIPNGNMILTAKFESNSNCSFSGELVQGAEYIYNNYTYRYKQKYNGTGWDNIEEDGWGVTLTNKNSTSGVSSYTCGYVANKPVVAMSYMYYNSKASYLNLKGYVKTASVIYMNNMFENTVVNYINFSELNTPNVKDMSEIFKGNTNLKNVDLSNINIAKVEHMDSMFEGCTSLEDVNLNNWYVKNLSNIGNNLFKNASVKSLKTNNWIIPETFSDLFGTTFAGANIEKIDVMGWDLSNTKNIKGLFANCSGLKEIIGLDTWDTPNIVKTDYMFEGCGLLQELNLSTFNTSKVTNMNSMFNGASNLKTIYTSEKFDVSNVTNSDNMFYNTSKIVGGLGTVYDSNHIDKEYAHLDDGVDNPGYFDSHDISKFTITFNANGGNLNKNLKIVKNGNKIGALPTPEWDDYHEFEGWYIGIDSVIEIDENYIPESDITIYARWTTLPSYEIKFDNNGGGYLPNKYIAKGSALGTLPTPEKTDWIFDGWYSDIALENSVDESYVPDGDITLYAKWFKSIEGALILNPSIELNYDNQQIQIEIANKEEIEDCIYSTTASALTIDENGLVTLKPGESVGISYPTSITITGARTNKTRTIQVRVSISSYRVNYNANGGTVNTSYVYVGVGREISSLPTPTNSPYTFEGWYYNGERINETFVPTADTTLIAKWNNRCGDFIVDSWDTIKENIENDMTYYPVGCMKHIEYDLEEEKDDEIVNKNYVSAIRIANNTQPSECVSNEFSQTGCGVVIEFVDAIKTIKMNPYIVDDNTSYGNGNKGGWKYTKIREYVNNDVYNALPNDLKNIIIDTKTISGHGSNDSENIATTDKLYLLGAHEVIDNISSNDLKEKDTAYNQTRKLDYYSNGNVVKNNTKWWLRTAYADDSGSFFYVPGSSVSKITSTNTLDVIPAFRIFSTNLVALNANGGTVNPDYKNFKIGDSIGALPIPEYDEYEIFEGWYTGIDSGIKVDETFIPNGDMTLFARWIDLPHYEVTYDTNGSNNVKMKKIDIGDSIGDLPTVAKKDYYLDGWYLEPTFDTPVDSSYVPSNNITIYAKWIESKCEEFETDSWNTIKTNITNEPLYYKVGCTKTISFDSDNNGTPETYKLRIANNTRPTVCSSNDFSQTACGFVVEFEDILTTTKRMNPTGSSSTNGYYNKGGWQYSEMRTYLNSTIYNVLPSDLKSIIIDTRVVSGRGPNDSNNFITTDKLYLSSTHEIMEDVGSGNYRIGVLDKAYDQTRQLDYYKYNDVTTSNYSKAIKKRNNSSTNYWLRSAYSYSYYYFYSVVSSGSISYYNASNTTYLEIEKYIILIL